MIDKPQNVLTWLSVLFAVFTVLVTVVFFSWWGFKDHFAFGDTPFEPVGWMIPARPYAECARGDMVRDIQRNHLRRGMHKSEVTRLLGRPDWEEPGQIEYEIGVCMWVVHGLRLYFSPDERLLHSAIVKH